MSEQNSQLDLEKREKILRSAKDLFSRFGFKKATVDEIAEAAGISKRTLYDVFVSKESLLAELVTSEALSFRRELVGHLKRLDDPVKKLRLLCELTVRYFDENPFLGQVLGDDAGLYTPFLGNEIVLIEVGMQEMIARILTEGIQTRAFRAMNVKATAACIFVLYRGFTYRRTPATNGVEEWVPFVLKAIEAAR